MIKLYFGNVPSILSTLLFLAFILFFIKTIKKDESNKKWKKAAILTVLMGTAMSMLSGIKDCFGDSMAVSFEQMNLSLAVLSAMGGMALLIGLVAVFCKKEKVNKVLFFTLCFIIIAKTFIVEILRISDYLAK